MTYGIGYINEEGNVEDLPKIQVSLQPFESKLIKLVVYNENPTKDIVDLTVFVSEILDVTDVRISTIESSPTTWNRTTSLVQEKAQYPLYLSVTNKYYCESLVDITIEYKQYKAPITTMSYHGDLLKPDVKDIYYLPRDIEVKSNRTLVINPTPEGATYTYLSYSHGNHLIFLDNRSGIIYKPNDITNIINEENTG